MSQIREITAEQTFNVRLSVLQAGKQKGDSHFDGDDLPETKHFALYEANEIAGIISLFENHNPHFREKMQCQLRGMAIRDEFRNKGYSEMLIQHIECYLKNKNGQVLWFNARIIAVDFYRRLGFDTIGPPFEIANIGFHYVMYKKL